MSRPIESILIVGSGLAAWASAALLARATGGRVAIRVVADAAQPDVDCETTMASCRPDVLQVHDSLGIDEVAFMRATSATFKLATEFRDWNSPGKSYLQGFSDIGARLDAVPFHQLLNRMRLAGESMVSPDEYSLAAVAARAGRFTHPSTDKRSIGSTYSYAYHFDVAAAAEYLKSLAQRQGVRHLQGHVLDVSVREDGHVQSVKLDSGEQAGAQLFLDCSGTNSRLLGQALGVPFDSWQRWLPCDRAVLSRIPRAGDPAPATVASARAAGWRLSVPLQGFDLNAFFYASGSGTEDQAAGELAGSSGPSGDIRSMAFASGRRREFWVGNCVAIGAAGALVDPLGSTGLQLTCNAIARLIGLFPHEDCPPAVVSEFNRVTAVEHECARDFAALHYCTSSRNDSSFWRECRNMCPPEQLEYKLKLFRHSGHLAPFDDELFDASEWVNALLGQDVWPMHPYPLTLSLDVRELVTRTGRMHQLMRQAADQMPVHRLYLERLGIAGHTSGAPRA